MSGHTGRRDARIRATRQDDEREVASVSGYLIEGGGRRAWRGDEAFPFVKDPPDIGAPIRYLRVEDANYAPGIFVDGPRLDVGGYRLVSLFIDWQPAVVDYELSILPETARSGSGGLIWYPIGVVSPVLVVPDTISGLEGYAMREAFPSEIRLRPALGFSPPLPPSAKTQLVLNFDVSTYADFRFRFAETRPTPASVNFTLDVHYVLQR